MSKNWAFKGFWVSLLRLDIVTAYIIPLNHGSPLVLFTWFLSQECIVRNILQISMLLPIHSRLFFEFVHEFFTTQDYRLLFLALLEYHAMRANFPFVQARFLFYLFCLASIPRLSFSTRLLHISLAQCKEFNV